VGFSGSESTNESKKRISSRIEATVWSSLRESLHEAKDARLGSKGVLNGSRNGACTLSWNSNSGRPLR
jgi:hypothetical protein